MELSICGSEQVTQSSVGVQAGGCMFQRSCQSGFKVRYLSIPSIRHGRCLKSLLKVVVNDTNSTCKG